MARYLVTVPHPYSIKVGGTDTRPVTINVEASSGMGAQKALIDFGIPWVAANTFMAGGASKYTVDSGTKLENIDPQTGTVRGGAGGGGDQSTGEGDVNVGRYGKALPGSTGAGGEAAGSNAGGAGTASGDQRDIIDQLNKIGLMEPGVIDDLSPGTPFSQDLFDQHTNAGNDRYSNAYDNDPRNTFDTDPYGDGSDQRGAGGGGGGGGASGSGDRGDGGRADNNFKSASELALLYPDVEMNPRQQKIIDGILNGEYTPEELADILNDPEFQAIFETPLGPILNPALQLAVTNATEQLKVSGGITQADAGATDAGALLRSGATVDQILEGVRVGVSGLSSNEQVLESQKISSSGGFSEVTDMLKQQRIAASGGLDNNIDILAMQQAEAADNAFGSLQVGADDPARMANILSIIEAQNSGQSGANAVGREQNFLNFIKSPEAVGAATAMGFDIQGMFKDMEDGQVTEKAKDEVTAMQDAIKSESDAGVGSVSVKTAEDALKMQDPESGFNNEKRETETPFAGFAPNGYNEEGSGVDDGVGSINPNYQMQDLRYRGDDPLDTAINRPMRQVQLGSQQVPNLGAKGGVGSSGIGATSGIGALRGLTQNFTEGQYDNRSNSEQGSIRGQLAADQGIGQDEVEKRARSYTPGDSSTRRQLV